MSVAIHEPVGSTLADAARMYAEHGVAIFPVTPRGKLPALPRCTKLDRGHRPDECDGGDGHGFHDATTDLDRIAAWWAERPDANIGIALGANGIFAVDVDGPEGRAALDELEKLYTPLPATYEVVTGRAEGGGRHYIFRQPDDLTVRNAKIGPKLETRGDGGYVVAPPSIHESGRAYLASGSWAQIADAPRWLVIVATKPPEPTPTPTPHLEAPAGADTVADKRLRGLAGHLAMMAPDTGRNNALNHAAYTAGQLIGAGRLDRDHVEQTLTVAAERCGLTARETAATIRSGIDAGIQDPDHDQPAPPLPPLTTLTGPDVPTDPSGAPAATSGLDALRASPEFATIVAQEVTRTLARDQAREIITREQLDQQPIPPLIDLPTFLATPDPQVTYRVEGLWPAGGRVLLAAQYKAGKTTAVGNLIRTLVDGEPFLGTYPVTPPDGQVVLIDDELHENTLRRWLRDQDIEHAERVHLIPLRGRLTTLNLLDPAVRTAWADQLRAVGASIVILDCLRPIVDALGLSEDKDVGKVLTALDELLHEAGVDEAVIVHHMGHHGERSRGDSRLRDWPDAEWKIVRQTTDDGEEDPTATRFFSALGRDVLVEESELQLEVDGRRLTIVGGNRRDARLRVVIDAVVTAVQASPGLTLRALRDAVREITDARNADIDRARDRAILEHLIRTVPGPRGAHLHHPAITTVPRVPDRAPDLGHGRQIDLEPGPEPAVSTSENATVPRVPHRAPDSGHAQPTVPQGGISPLRGETPGHAGWTRGEDPADTDPDTDDPGTVGPLPDCIVCGTPTLDRVRRIHQRCVDTGAQP